MNIINLENTEDQTEEICLEAVKENWMNLQYVKNHKYWYFIYIYIIM